MGLVCNNNNNNNNNNSFSSYNYLSRYKSETSCRKDISRQRRNKVLTRQNIKFLKSLGLNVVPGGRSLV